MISIQAKFQTPVPSILGHIGVDQTCKHNLQPRNGSKNLFGIGGTLSKGSHCLIRISMEGEGNKMYFQNTSLRKK